MLVEAGRETGLHNILCSKKKKIRRVQKQEREKKCISILKGERKKTGMGALIEREINTEEGITCVCICITMIKQIGNMNLRVRG